MKEKKPTRFDKRVDTKPCPFCKSEKVKADSKKGNNFKYEGGKRHNYYVVTVRCGSCHCRGPAASVWLQAGNWTIPDEAIDRAYELWNTRPE